MPDYLPAVRGVRYSLALLEASAVSPDHRAMLETFEIYHEDGTPAGAIYLVANPVDIVAAKEATADRDAGVAVRFTAAQILSEVAEESDGAPAPERGLRLGNVQGVASLALRRGRGSLVPWEIQERLYASDDLTGPAILPILSLLIGKAVITSLEVAFTATYGDPANVSVPGILFRRAEYSTLSP